MSFHIFDPLIMYPISVSRGPHHLRGVQRKPCSESVPDVQNTTCQQPHVQKQVKKKISTIQKLKHQTCPGNWRSLLEHCRRRTRGGGAAPRQLPPSLPTSPPSPPPLPSLPPSSPSPPPLTSRLGRPQQRHQWMKNTRLLLLTFYLKLIGGFALQSCRQILGF